MESLASRTSSRTHFQVLGLGLEASSPWPRSLRSSKIALSSARGQHYFLNRWNFVGKRQKPRGKFANTVFVFRNWSIGLAKRASHPIEISPMTKMWQKTNCFCSFSFFVAFFAYTSSEQWYWRPGAPEPPQNQFLPANLNVNLEEMDSFCPKSCYLRITSSLFMNVMHKPRPDLPQYGAVPAVRALCSNLNTFYGLYLHWAVRCCENLQSARGPARCKSGPAITWLVRVTIYCTIFQ